MLLGLERWASWWLSGKESACQQETEETQVQSLGREDPLEAEMVTQSGVLAWIIPRPEEPGRLQSVGSQRVSHDWVPQHPHTGLRGG